MANLIQSDVAISQFLAAIIAAMNGASMTLRLFKNNHVPVDADVLADYTEADFGGYSAIGFSDMGSVSVSAHVATSIGVLKTFTATGASTNNIYGYYVTDGGGTVLLWAQRDDFAPVGIGNPGDTYHVIPRLTYKSEF